MTRSHSLAIAAILGASLAGCSSATGFTPPPSSSGGGPTSNIKQTATISVPGIGPTTPAWTFDIGFVDPSVHQYYLADRVANGIDVVNTTTNKFVMTAGKGAFVGANANSDLAGPDGVVPIGGGLVMAGDGNSTMKVVNINTGALVYTSPITGPNPDTSGGPPGCTQPKGPGTGPGPAGANQGRVDEMALDATDGGVLAVNDASCPPFATFFSTTGPNYPALWAVAFSDANGGMEQPTWDPKQNLFFVGQPTSTTNDNGVIAVVDPTTHQEINEIQLPAGGCQPAGTALGANEDLFLGCGGQQLLIINVANARSFTHNPPAKVIATIPNVGGADEVWYNPTTKQFYAAGTNNVASAGGPGLIVVDEATGTATQLVTTTSGAHSVAADPTTNNIYVPLRGTTNAIGVFH